MSVQRTSSTARRRLALCLEYPIGLQGGVSVLVRALAKELSSDHALVLVSPDTAGEARASEIGHLLSAHLHWPAATISRAVSRQLASDLAALGVGIAHFHFGGNFGWGARVPGGSPIGFTARKGIRVFTAVHLITRLLEGYCGPEKPTWFKLLLLPGAWLGKMQVLSCAEREVAVSRHDLNLLLRWYRPMASKFVQIYHSQIADPAPRVNVVRERLILNVGHIAQRKGQKVLVEAFATIADRYPDWKLGLVGHFAEAWHEEDIRGFIAARRLQNRVLLPGPDNDPASWMRRSSIYVQPSFQEALGLALQEAMHAGCACIGTAIGGIPELLAEGTGLLIPSGNVAELAGALVKLIDSLTLRETLGHAARQSIEERGMTRAAMAAHYRELYGRR